MGISWLEHNGEKIFYLDLSGLSEDDQLKTMDTAIKEFEKLSPNSIYEIVNVSNTDTTSKVKKKAEETVEKGKPYVKAMAIIGVKGVKKLIAKALVKSMHFADSLDDAKDWLIKQ